MQHVNSLQMPALLLLFQSQVIRSRSKTKTKCAILDQCSETNEETNFKIQTSTLTNYYNELTFQ